MEDIMGKHRQHCQVCWRDGRMDGRRPARPLRCYARGNLTYGSFPAFLVRFFSFSCTCTACITHVGKLYCYPI